MLRRQEFIRRTFTPGNGKPSYFRVSPSAFARCLLGDAPRHRIQLEAGALRRVFQERESFHRRGETVEEMTYSSAVVPILGSERVLGAVYADDLKSMSPIREPDLHLLAALGKVAGAAIEGVRRAQRLQEEKENLRRLVAEETEIVGESAAMQDVMDLIGSAAQADGPVLVRGEGGAGREIVARAIHLNSRRAGGPWVTLHCAAVPPEGVAIELFGHEKDVFPGADVRKKGRLELAHGGTLLLDAVGEMDAGCQEEVARFLETGTFRRAGGTEDLRADVRIIAGTTRDLSDARSRGTFRDDLLSRLGAVEIVLPPLRERREDVFPLVRHFLDQFGERMGRRMEGLTPEAETLLQGYEWPGNVRELRNVVERAMLSTTGTELRPEDFPSLLAARAGGRETARTLEEVEREHVARVLRLAGGNAAEAARLLGLSRAQLLETMERLNLPG
ncbi:MAG: sigma-54-dependent Fis family transcriptional regulator [Planctomycetes bacterium]|nr:sigma-54-dependent Fis family transcriptional regulator [Planctomycetota bacterium]